MPASEEQPNLFSQVVPVTDPLHRDQLMLLTGMRTIVDRLKAEKCTYPGMVLAIAVAERAMANEQVILASMAYRSAIRAGADMSSVTGIRTEFSDDGYVMRIDSTEAPSRQPPQSSSSSPDLIRGSTRGPSEEV